MQAGTDTLVSNVTYNARGQMVMLDRSGGVVGGSTTRYLPFGNYRGAAPNQTITDRDFTGQPQNRTVGLLYYQARFYVPGIGRFASADTLVPDPANPQQFNRYSYVLNNALRYTDPTGHCIGQLPCPRPIKEAIDLVTGYDGCVDNSRACTEYVFENISEGFYGMAPQLEGDTQREHAYPDYVTVQGSFLYPRGYGPRPNQMIGFRPDIVPTEGELEALNRGLSTGAGAGFVLGADISVPLNNSLLRIP